MTEAASVFGGGELTIKVDGCRYDLSGNPKMRVTDYTPIDEVIYASAPGSTTFIVKTKPKTVWTSGWVNVYRASFDNYKTTPDNRRPSPQVYNSKEAAEQAVRLLSYPAERQMFIATAKIEWEEEVE